jgi:CubicO group peptidase (beta-lactamase class C family)
MKHLPNNPIALVIAAVLLTFLIFLSVAPATLSADATTDKVDKLFAAWDKTTTPGATLAVIKDGKIVYERGYGMAKLEDGIINTPDKVFDIGSVSKQFTATCVAMLIREGKVGLEDDIHKYLPEMPVYEKPVTVNHLLHHTSGLRDYNELLCLAGFRPESDSPTVEEALEVIRRQKKLNYTPGEEYSYTNTGFFLLGQIVERVSGKSLNAFAQERIFKPLGMTKTLFQDDHTQIIKDRATGYAQGKMGYTISMSNWDETGDGNVYTTARDLYRWDQAFYTNALGKDLMDMLHTQGVLNSGKKIDYAFGLVVSEYKGLKVVEHGGAWVGFRAALVRFPEQKFSVVVLANLETIDPSRLAFGVADIYLAGQLKEPPKEEAKAAATITVPQAELEALAGNWQENKFGIWLVLATRPTKFIASLGGRDYALAAVGPGKFIVPDNPAGFVFEFAALEKGKPARLKLNIGTSQEFQFEKATPVKALTAGELAGYAGTYVSEELLDARYIISVDKETLVVKTRDTPRAVLKLMALDKFTLPDYGLNIEFVRGRDGKVSGFTVSVGRAGGIAFAKK